MVTDIRCSEKPGPGPTVIKLFESENELKCNNLLHDFIKILSLFSNFWEILNTLFNHLAKFPFF